LQITPKEIVFLVIKDIRIKFLQLKEKCENMWGDIERYEKGFSGEMVCVCVVLLVGSTKSSSLALTSWLCLG